jgi:hypothetical protein
MATQTKTSKADTVEIRDRNGRFTAGNPGGPGRPKRDEETRRQFLSTISRMIDQPSRFSERQRNQLVELLTSFMDGSDQQAIAAATVLVEMNAVGIRQGR